MHQTTEDTYWEQGFLNGIDIFSKDEINECQKHFDKLEARVGRETCQVGLINSHFQEQFVWEMVTNSSSIPSGSLESSPAPGPGYFQAFS
jgi:hypothetical protein